MVLWAAGLPPLLLQLLFPARDALVAAAVAAGGGGSALDPRRSRGRIRVFGGRGRHVGSRHFYDFMTNED